MAFTLETFLPISAQANSDAPRFFTYETSDALSDIAAADYFKSKINEIDSGDLLYAVCSDGRYILSLEVSGGVVSVDVIDNSGAGGQMKDVLANYTALSSDRDLCVIGAGITIKVPDNRQAVLTIYAATDTVSLVNSNDDPLQIDNFVLSTIPVGESRTLIWSATRGYIAE